VRFGDHVICVSGYRGAFACSISLDATGDVTKSDRLAWTLDKGTPYVPSPLLVDDRLYFTLRNEPVLTCLDARTGKPVYEGVRLPRLGTLYGSPTAAPGRIYLSDREGRTLVFKQGDKFEVLAQNRLPDSFDASPAIVGKSLFLRGEKHLYCVEAP
jgi:outer membrane protein assembly factor BamB